MAIFGHHISELFHFKCFCSHTIDFEWSYPIFSTGKDLVRGSGPNEESGGERESFTVVKDKVKLPKRYKVLLHNDDYSTMEFVIHVLQSVFGKSMIEAQALMMKVHMEGVAVCGIYTHEIAETKTSKVAQLAKEHGHPLKCTMEEE